MAKMTQKQKLNLAVLTMKVAGYDPVAQLTGYLKTGNLAYITRQDGARKLVSEINPAVIKRYLSEQPRMQVA